MTCKHKILYMHKVARGLAMCVCVCMCEREREREREYHGLIGGARDGEVVPQQVANATSHTFSNVSAYRTFTVCKSL